MHQTAKHNYLVTCQMCICEGVMKQKLYYKQYIVRHIARIGEYLWLKSLH